MSSNIITEMHNMIYSEMKFVDATANYNLEILYISMYLNAYCYNNIMNYIYIVNSPYTIGKDHYI